MKTVPENTKDLKRMKETSNGWFDGTIERVKLKDNESIAVGDAIFRATKLWIPGYSDVITVKYVEDICTAIYSEKRWTSEGVVCSSEEYTFDEFRKSDLWDKAMNAFKGGDCDASIFDAIDIDQEEGNVSISLGVKRFTKDWLGNTRLQKGYDKLRIDAATSGDLYIAYEQKSFEGTPEELFQLINEANRFKELGITADADKDGLEIKIKHGDAE